MSDELKKLTEQSHKEITSDNGIACIIIDEKKYDSIMNKINGVPFSVSTDFNILHDGLGHVFVETVLTFSVGGIIEKFLINVNENFRFFESLAKNPNIVMASSHPKNGKFIAIQLPRTEKVSEALFIIQSALNKGNSDTLKELKKITDQRNKDDDEKLKENYEKNLEAFNKHAESFPTKDYDSEQISEKQCYSCTTKLIWPDIHSCYYCQKNYCSEHRLAENHKCPKVMAAKHIEKDYLRKKGVNITTAKFAVICRSCGYESEYAYIEKVNQIRIEHIKQNHCKSETVRLRQHEDNKIEDEQFIQKTYPTVQGNTWMYGCLEDAKQVILNQHDAEGIAEFFAEAKFSISIQDDRKDAYGYIDGSFPFYRIGIHKALEKNSPESHKMVTLVLIHEILHALHHDWSESQVQNEERRLANLGMHYDALQNLDVLYLSGKMRLCRD